VAADDTRLMKIHGMYQQDDRDLRDERRRQKLEPAYRFMIRVRLPGGVCTAEQWLKLDALARAHGGETLRLTTRQTFQFHWVLKEDVRATIQGLHEALLDTIAACGDVSRNVMCAADPESSALHSEVVAAAHEVSGHFLPKTRAYHEIWYGEEKVAGSAGEEQEPFYGATYLPRKFKIGFVVPPSNDIDVYTQDLGFIAIGGPDGLEGYNVAIGGGMGRTENEPTTYPRLADVIGYIGKDRLVATTGAAMSVQRDYGNRLQRNRARFKYTIDDKGLDWIKAQIESRLGAPLEPARPFHFDSNGDVFGWRETGGGRLNCTLYVESGRLANRPGRAWLDGMRAIAAIHRGSFRVTPNQNLIVAGIAPEDRPAVEALLAVHGLAGGSESAIRRNSIACVALPTCGLAMAEAERYLPDLLTRIEALLSLNGLLGEPITFRISGCPNGCSRPYVAEIALTGRAPGKYNLYLGGGFHGERLNRMVRENVGEAEILEVLEDLLGRYAAERLAQERLGDFAERVSYLASETQIPGRISPVI
jgi:sulfite reductase (NADPH) hemoprotein beta-component